MNHRQKDDQNGFAGLEAVLIIIIIVAVVGVGYWVMKQRKTTTSASLVNTAQTSTAPQPLDASKVGTTAGIDQLVQTEFQAEDTINQKYVANEKTNVTSTNPAQQAIGGAYNESTY